MAEWMTMKKSLRFICVTAIGIALYVAVSMVVKIPIIGHISLDLGYIVLAVYCYMYGPLCGAVVGGIGCTLVSLLSSGWFPLGWLLGNVFVGWLCGARYKDSGRWKNIIWTILAVFIGVLCIKTGVECLLYNIPLMTKLPKNAAAFAMDAVVMCFGVLLAPKVKRIAVT